MQESGAVCRMCGKIKSSEFIQFDFRSSATVQTNLDCSYSFQPQHPVGTDDKVLAILVLFQADSPKDIVHFHAQCRVVFDVSDADEVPSEDDFLAENYRAAYQEFCSRANDAFAVLGQNPFDFHEI